MPIRTIAAALAVLVLTAPATAQQLPSWSIADICRADSAPGQCALSEARALGAVSGSWGVIQPEVRSACLAGMSEKDRSWRNLADCIDIETRRVLADHGIATGFTPAEPVPAPTAAEQPRETAPSAAAAPVSPPAPASPAAASPVQPAEPAKPAEPPASPATPAAQQPAKSD
jgi:hypothetical protein